MAKPASKVKSPQRGYADLHDHVAALEREGLLVRVRREINKDTEMHPLVRWQYRGGLKEKDWRGFLFERVTDAKGRRYDMPVGVGIMAGSKHICAVGLGCRPDQIWEKWEQAFRNPIDPILVERGPVQELIQKKDELRRAGGLDQFPIPISTPGFDGAPFITAGHWVTKDPETGIRNVGNYRGHLKARDRIGIFPGPGQHVLAHWHKSRERKIPLEAAIVVGPPPLVSYAAVQKVAYGVDELAVAGGLAGEPIRLVKCQTVDLEVPAEAETWRALMGAATFHPGVGKLLVAVDEDIDPWDMDMVMWALSYRSMPHQDVQILTGRERGHGPPFSRQDQPVETREAAESALLINAILREPFPPVSLPKREYMENARKIWEELGCLRSRPSPLGMATRSAIGTKSWRQKPSLPWKGNT